ncbi:MAG TPA: M3 family oligoendopeptidase [Candidatus Omnitrophota bacterium]|nr:M3 family oligoendopeptidase [Candidatus Omnitrophota bacterium]HSA31077.1 M3 family oligoendopeptidase [Candidatus Omnitrophota bacterium]
MTEHDFSRISRYQERTFVPEGVDFNDRDEAVELYTQLLDRDIRSAKELEQWLKDCSELAAAVDQHGSILYILMTCDTSHAEHAYNYQKFIKDVVPAVKPLGDELNRKYLAMNDQFPLDAKRYFIFHRSVQTDVDLFWAENVPLETDVQLLSQEYQSVFGSMTVDFDGQEMTLPQMSKFQEEIDRSLRERAWRLTAQRRYQDQDRLESIFERMFSIRHKIARNAGFGNFRDYQFAGYHRFDYSPDHCKRYHETIERVVVPLWDKILERRRQQMKLAHLRPWDLSVDPFGRPPLKPFTTADQLTKGVSRIVRRIDPEFGDMFDEMRQLGLLDLESRKGKAPGGYQNTLSEARKPFIFMNAVGIDDDVRTLLHESGHAFHAMYSATEFLHTYRRAPIEFCEVASMSMELLADHHMDEFYGAEDHKRSRTTHLENIIHILAWVANVDSFQHWMYEHADHTRQDRIRKWVELYERFAGTLVDWTGLDLYKETLWHRQLHIFEVPFYYIEYGIAQLGALQIWQRSRKDLPGALNTFKKALSLGGSCSLPELFATAGIEFDFSEKTIRPLVNDIARELEL